MKRPTRVTMDGKICSIDWRKKDIGRAEAILIGADYVDQLIGQLGPQIGVLPDPVVDSRVPTPPGYSRDWVNT